MNLALVLAAHLCVPALAGQTPGEPTVVKLERQNGVELWTVRADEATVRALLARVAELSERGIDGGPTLARAPRITITLARRPLEELLEYALGSAGLRFALDGQTIHVLPERAPEETPEQRAELAAAAWERLATHHPRLALASAAHLSLGELEELRGRPDAARRRYLELLMRAPASDAAGEAYLRAGRIAGQRGDWSEASEHFRALANLSGADAYRSVARVELARATLNLGDANGALHILDALDAAQPSWEGPELTARSLVRIEALLSEARFQDALDVIDAYGAEFDPLGAPELPLLRARALEGTGQADEASRAWLFVARAAAPSERGFAYRSAAHQAELSGDPLAVLYVAREARLTGCGADVAEAERRANADLARADAPRAASASTPTSMPTSTSAPAPAELGRDY